ncbi:metal-dependent hydrolase [Candidatus Thioglobus autotrophicus]|uniref:metal-dependent hydrolase n=1 Tax=Candidatus Thioglobus autotrophicus TaxID=1705394 RepID=UPI00299EE356|nr:metal-dependent hydrolase [Candidatus Thioglobus autotrophicus]WPE18654.1 metal-dependent hydrolase [Candidatus Thioglobus autotrophicus]
MDSITQFSLGAVIGIAVSPKKTAKVALISGLVATIPDLDIFLSHADDLTRTIEHRGFSHALFYLSLISPLIAFLLYKSFALMGYLRWLLLVFLVLATHPILDSLTIYGTSLFLPFSDFKPMIGSIFIIDPVYTLPLIISISYLFIRKKVLFIRNISFNTIALIFSQVYLLSTFLIQQAIVPNGKSFATPTPFNSLLWRVVIMEDDYIRQYFVDIFGNKGMEIKVENRHYLKNINSQVVNKYADFSSDFYNLAIDNNKLILQDLRMGNIKNPSFSFVVAEFSKGKWMAVVPSRNAMNFQLKGMFANEQL